MSKESKHVTAFCDRHLKPGEKMVCHVEGYTGDVMGSGSKTQHNGALVVTDQRVAFYRKGFIGDVFQSIPLAKLTSVEQRSTMGLKTVIMHTSHDELSFKTFDKDGFESAVAAVEQGRDYAAVSPAPGTPSSADDPIESLKRLKDLHVAGILSDAEYEAKKKELLSRM